MNSFRIKLEVNDGDADAVFVLFDTDSQQLLSRSCQQLVNSSKVIIKYGGFWSKCCIALFPYFQIMSLVYLIICCHVYIL